MKALVGAFNQEKALVGAFNQEKALVGAFSVIIQPVVEPMEHYTALIVTGEWRQCPASVAGPAEQVPPAQPR